MAKYVGTIVRTELNKTQTEIFCFGFVFLFPFLFYFYAMDNISIILELEKKRDELLAGAKALDVSISIFKGDATTKETGAVTTVEARNSNTRSIENVQFALPSKPEEQIVHVLTVFGKAIRLPDLQKLFTETTGNEKSIENTVRRLKDEGTLTAVRYNKANKQTYWALNGWLNENGSDYRDEFKPLLGFVVTHSEVTGDKK